MGTRDNGPLPASKIVKGYVTARAERWPGLHRVARVHIVETQSWPPLQLPVADKNALCGVKTADYRHTERVPVSRATCPACKREHRKRTGLTEPEVIAADLRDGKITPTEVQSMIMDKVSNRYQRH
jgi:hypothetical protein